MGSLQYGKSRKILWRKCNFECDEDCRIAVWNEAKITKITKISGFGGIILVENNSINENVNKIKPVSFLGVSIKNIDKHLLKPWLFKTKPVISWRYLWNVRHYAVSLRLFFAVESWNFDKKITSSITLQRERVARLEKFVEKRNGKFLSLQQNIRTQAQSQTYLNET